MRYKRKENIVMRKFHETNFLIDITDNYLNEKCSLYEINQIGTFIWERIDNMDIRAISTCLWEALSDDVPFEIIFLDVKNFLENLLQNDFVEEES